MIVDLEELRTVRLHPDDVIILRLDHLPDSAEVERLAAELERIFPDNRTLVLAPGCDVEVIRPADLDDDTTTTEGEG